MIETLERLQLFYFVASDVNLGQILFFLFSKNLFTSKISIDIEINQVAFILTCLMVFHA